MHSSTCSLFINAGLIWLGSFFPVLYVSRKAYLPFNTCLINTVAKKYWGWLTAPMFNDSSVVPLGWLNCCGLWLRDILLMVIQSDWGTDCAFAKIWALPSNSVAIEHQTGFQHCARIKINNRHSSISCPKIQIQLAFKKSFFEGDTNYTATFFFLGGDLLGYFLVFY